jgi:hypothetical protein
MTSLIGEQGSDGGGLDLAAVTRDADLLDLLARRGPVPAGDPVLALLAAFAADVDEGLDELLVASEDDPVLRAAWGATMVPDPPAPRRGHGLRATTVAVVVGATLSIGGVAAAVTGDPLAPVRGIATAVGIGADKHEGKTNARDAAKQARTNLAHGDVAGAQARLADMKAQLLRDDLSDGDRRSIEARIDALQQQVDRAVADLAAEQQSNANGADDGNEGNDGNDGNAKESDNGGGKVTKPEGERSGGGTEEKATTGKPTGKPDVTRATEPGADDQGRATDEDETSDPTTDATAGATQPSHPATSGGQTRQRTADASDDAEDAPAVDTADPSTTADGSGATGEATDGSESADG